MGFSPPYPPLSTPLNTVQHSRSRFEKKSSTFFLSQVQTCFRICIQLATDLFLSCTCVLYTASNQDYAKSQLRQWYTTIMRASQPWYNLSIPLPLRLVCATSGNGSLRLYVLTECLLFPSDHPNLEVLVCSHFF